MTVLAALSLKTISAKFTNKTAAKEVGFEVAMM